jgi:hypothetical protein
MALPHKSDGGSKPLSLFSLKHHVRRAAEGATHFARQGGKWSYNEEIIEIPINHRRCYCRDSVSWIEEEHQFAEYANP